MKTIFFSILFTSSLTSTTANPEHQQLLATIQNGHIFNAVGQSINRRELANLGFPLSEQELKKIRVFNIYAIKSKPTSKIQKVKDIYFQASKQTKQCRFDVNNNQVCDFYVAGDVKVENIDHKEVIQYIYQGTKEICWIPNAQKCEFHLKMAESYMIQPKSSALYSLPLQKILNSKLRKVKVDIQIDQIITQHPVECRQYVVVLKMNEYSGYYHADFYEKEGLFKRKWIGYYNIPKLRWKVIVPGNIKAEGWLSC